MKLSSLLRYFARPHAVPSATPGRRATSTVNLKYCEYYGQFNVQKDASSNAVRRSKPGVIYDTPPSPAEPYAVWARPHLHVARMHAVSMTGNMEQYFLRVLLAHRAAFSFEELRTVSIDGVQTLLPSFREAAIALGLVVDGAEFTYAMSQAVEEAATPRELRWLFCNMAMHCGEEVPVQELIETFGPQMSMDLHDRSRPLDRRACYHSNWVSGVPTELNPLARVDLTLELDRVFSLEGKSVVTFGLPSAHSLLVSLTPTEQALFSLSDSSDLFRSFDRQEALREFEEKWSKAVPEQRAVISAVLDSIQVSTGMVSSAADACCTWCPLRPEVPAHDHDGNHFFFIDAPGGTGKTFVCRAIAAWVRAHGLVIMPTAFPGERNTHTRCIINFSTSTFCFPV